MLKYVFEGRGTMVIKPSAKTSEANKPVKVIRVGGVKASIWKNDFKLKDGTVREQHSVTIIRSYKDKNDEWQETNSYNPDSLADLENVAHEARMFLKLKEQ